MSESKSEAEKQALYRDARYLNKYDDIWQTVGKCAFCDLKDKYIFFEENGIVMTISLYAYIDGHFMIIPRRHVRSVKDLTEREWQTVREFMYLAKKLIRKVHGTKGMQFVQKDGANAQSTVEHLHFHCIPFDSPDLATWNFRKLENTPLENVAQYKQAAKQIISIKQKFETKYRNPSGLAVVVDAIIMNEKNEVLFEERSNSQKLSPNYIVLPGGLVDNFSATLEEELAREVHEETGLKIDQKSSKLVSSEITYLDREVASKPLERTYVHRDQFVRNTYTVKSITTKTKLTPGDDSNGFMWVPLDKIASHPRISPGTKGVFERINL